MESNLRADKHFFRICFRFNYLRRAVMQCPEQCFYKRFILHSNKTGHKKMLKFLRYISYQISNSFLSKRLRTLNVLFMQFNTQLVIIT